MNDSNTHIERTRFPTHLNQLGRGKRVRDQLELNGDFKQLVKPSTKGFLSGAAQ